MTEQTDAAEVETLAIPWPDPNNWPSDAEFVAMVKSVPADFPLCDCGVRDGTSEATNPADRSEVLPHHFDCSAVSAWAAVRTWAAAAEARGAERALRPIRRLVSSWEHGNDTFGATDRERNRTAVLREIVGDEAHAAADARGAEEGAGA